MPTSVLYGDSIFNTIRRRDDASTMFATQATARGLVAEQVYPSVPAGLVSHPSENGRPALSFCFTGDTTAIDAAATDLKAYFDANGYVDGYFGTAYVRE